MNTCSNICWLCELWDKMYALINLLHFSTIKTFFSSLFLILYILLLLLLKKRFIFMCIYGTYPYFKSYFLQQQSIVDHFWILKAAVMLTLSTSWKICSFNYKQDMLLAILLPWGFSRQNLIYLSILKSKISVFFQNILFP